MIDFHCHIIPGLDDGPRSWAESLDMARIAQSDGISAVVCTPHVKRRYATPTLREISERAQELQRRLGDAGIDVELYVAAEVAIERNIAELIERGEIPTIGRSTQEALTPAASAPGGLVPGASVQAISAQEGPARATSVRATSAPAAFVPATSGPAASARYVLLELPWARIPPYTETVISELLSIHVTPVIAHLERYHQIIIDPGRARDFVEMGALAQVNAGSLTGMFGHDVSIAANILVSHRMAHVIGSDAHSSGRRSPRLREARQIIEDMLGTEYASQLTSQNARAIVSGRVLKPQQPQEYEGPRPASWKRGLLGRAAFYITRQLRGLK